MKKSESLEQITVIDFCEAKGWYIIHIPNEGKRSPRTGDLLKRMGLRPGFPDLFLFQPRGKWHGLAIEMKTPTGKVSKEQEENLLRLNKNGYAVKVAYSSTEAIESIERYMNLGGNQNDSV